MKLFCSSTSAFVKLKPQCLICFDKYFCENSNEIIYVDRIELFQTLTFLLGKRKEGRVGTEFVLVYKRKLRQALV